MHKILIVISNITDGTLAHLTDEYKGIRNALTSSEAKKHIELVSDPAPNYKSLSDILTSQSAKEIVIFHYSGHSDPDGIWVQGTTSSDKVGKTELVTLINAHRGLKLIFLNSCYSGAIAEKLAINGTYVIGTTTAIKDSAAAIVATKFYEFLVNNKTVQQAFDLTTDFFSDGQYVNNEVICKAFRGMKLPGKDPRQHPWQLYSNSADEQGTKDWYLVPQRHREMSLSTEKGSQYKLRVLGFYEDQDCRELFIDIKNYFYNLTKSNDVIFHGIDDIIEDYQLNEPDIQTEITSADIIIHISSGTKYSEFIDKFNEQTLGIVKQKQNIIIKYSKDSQIQYLLDKGIFSSQSSILPSNNLFQSIEEGKEIIPDYSRLKLNLIYNGLTDIFNNFINKRYINAKDLELAFNKFDYTSELVECRVYSAEKKLRLFIILEGTAECAQVLLLKKIIQLLHFGENIKTLKINLMSELQQMHNESDFYFNLSQTFSSGIQIDRSTFYEDGSFCISQLNALLKNQDILICIDNIGHDDEEVIKERKGIISSFVNKLASQINEKLLNRLCVFFINRNFPKANFSEIRWDKKASSTYSFDVIKIERLLSPEFNTWHANVQADFRQERFQHMHKDQVQFVDKYRQVSLTDICAYLNVETFVVSKILKL